MEGKKVQVPVEETDEICELCGKKSTNRKHAADNRPRDKPRPWMANFRAPTHIRLIPFALACHCRSLPSGGSSLG